MTQYMGPLFEENQFNWLIETKLINTLHNGNVILKQKLKYHHQ